MRSAANLAIDRPEVFQAAVWQFEIGRQEWHQRPECHQGQAQSGHVAGVADELEEPITIVLALQRAVRCDQVDAIGSKRKVRVPQFKGSGQVAAVRRLQCWTSHLLSETKTNGMSIDQTRLRFWGILTFFYFIFSNRKCLKVIGTAAAANRINRCQRKSAKHSFTQKTRPTMMARRVRQPKRSRMTKRRKMKAILDPHWTVYLQIHSKWRRYIDCDSFQC